MASKQADVCDVLPWFKTSSVQIPVEIDDSKMTKISTTESNWWNLTLVKSNSWLTIIAITILLGFSRTEYLFKLMVLSRKYMIKYEISKYLITFYIQGCPYISTLFKIDLWPHSIELLQFSSIVSIFLF